MYFTLNVYLLDYTITQIGTIILQSERTMRQNMS
jgi:hypothetical protein